MKATPAQARETWPCPLARTFAEKKGHNCMADHCPIWRWIPLSANDPAFKEAVSAEMKVIADERGKKPGPIFHKEAVARVMRQKDMTPTHGYCGLGGTPE